METFRETWYKVHQKWTEIRDSVTGDEHRDWTQMILDLKPLSIKDQTTLFQIRSNGLYSLLGGSLLSAAAAFWAVSRASTGWMRFRFPITFVSGWIGGSVGARQAQFFSRRQISTLEDPDLRAIMLADAEDRLSAREQISLRRNIYEKLDTANILKQETQKREMTAKDKIEHLKNERERLSKSQSKSASNSLQTPSETDSEPSTHATPHTPTPRQRLPEAIEAERRRASAKENEDSKSDS